MQHRQKQWILIAGAAPAFLLGALAWRHADWLLQAVARPADDLGSRLAFAIRWLLPAGLTLLIGIQGAARRGFSADAIDGTRTPRDPGLEINLRYNLNTLEQLVLAAVAWLALATTLPADRLLAIPLASFLFVLGRITFWIGYRLHPLGRAFGMTLTAAPTLCAYGWLTWRWAAA